MRYEEYNSLVLDFSNSVCYIADLETYELRHLTAAGMRTYGLEKPEEYQGRKCYEVLQGLDHPCPFCTNHLLVEGETYHWEYHNELLDRWFSLRDTRVTVEGRPCRLEIARDITAHKQEQKFLSEQLSMENLLM